MADRGGGHPPLRSGACGSACACPFRRSGRQAHRAGRVPAGGHGAAVAYGAIGRRRFRRPDVSREHRPPPAVHRRRPTSRASAPEGRGEGESDAVEDRHGRRRRSGRAGRYRGPRPRRLAGKVHHRTGVRLVPVPALHLLQHPLLADRPLRGQRHRQHRSGPLHPPRVRHVPRGARFPAVQDEPAPCDPVVRLGPGGTGGRLLPLSPRVQGRHRGPGRGPRAERSGGRERGDDRARDRGVPRARSAPGGGRERVRALRLLRAFGAAAGRDPLEGGVVRQGDVALLDPDRGGLRGRPGGVGLDDLPVRPVRGDPGEGGGGQLLHQALVLAARPLPRRAGQGRGGRLGDERDLLRLVDREHRDHRDVHHPADEAHRLLRGEGGGRWRSRHPPTASSRRR